MPGFNTQTPQRPNVPNRVRILLIANKLRTQLITNRRRTLLVGGGVLLFVLAVAGVSAAQESGIFTSGPNSDDPPGSTMLERTSFGATVAEDPETSALPSASSKPEGGEDTSEPTVGETEEPTVVAPVEERLTPGSNNVGKPLINIGSPRDDVRGAGQQKVTLCHKGKKTLTVGAPALAAHERHGDYEGACQPGGAGPASSRETVGPEAAKNGGGGGGGGQDKVPLCHKDKNTLTVGAPAQAAHVRHGDSLGACP